ncbi:MAG: hypothetical protein WD595_04910 [Waddliaceae bacterium]
MYNKKSNQIIFFNLALGLLSLFFLVFATGYAVLREREIPRVENIQNRPTLPKTAFEKNKAEYDKIAPPFLSLDFMPLSLRIPDLRRKILYFGTNERPDSDPQNSLLHFSLIGTNAVTSIPSEEPIYLKYKDGKYIFSEENKPTALWFQAIADSDRVEVAVTMQDEEGNLLDQPGEFSKFTLIKQQRQKPTSGKNWEIGKWRVDGTLLARQRARWYGTDKFLHQYGGDEFDDLLGKERIDFEGDDQKTYSVYLGPSNALIWKGNRWEEVIPGPDSLNYPLIHLKKIEGRLMRLEVWSPSGDQSLPLNIIKAAEPWNPKNEERCFQFAGARSCHQFQIKVDGKRMVLRPDDWLLKTEAGWIKLTSIQAVDDFIERKLIGPLFVFEGPSETDEGKVLKGTLFSPSRAEMAPVEIKIQQKISNSPSLNEYSEEELSSLIEEELDNYQ